MSTITSPNLAEVALSYKSKVKANDRPKVQSGRDAYELLKGIYSQDRVEHIEEAVILLLNQRMQMLGWAKISVGGITSTVIDVRLVFQYALKANATGVIISHNHPSGGLVPSEPDKLITKKIKQGGDILDIRLLDHVIYTTDGYYSFAEEAEI